MSRPLGLFGAEAGAYRAFRPAWPEALFERLLECTPVPRRRAVDLGAGTGLVASRLAACFDGVVAVEPDERMLAEFPMGPNLSLERSRAEEAEIEPASADLVTIGNALHWMEGARVVERARGWLREGGLLAVFRCNPPHAAEGAVDGVLAHEYGLAWRAHVHERLRETSYARRTLAESSFGDALEVHWIPRTLSFEMEELIGFLRSTSYAGGHARSLPDPEAYWVWLEERLGEVGGRGPFRLDFGVELLLAKKSQVVGGSA